MTSTQAKIKKVSSIFRGLFLVLLIVVPLVHILSWLNAPVPFDLSKSLGFFISVVPQGVKVLHTLSLSTKMVGFLIGAIPVVLIEFILYFLIKLFKLYAQAEIFSIQNVNYIKKIGNTLLITQIVAIICNGALSVVLTLNNPHGFRTLVLTISGMHISLILTAFIIILIAWIMAEGCQLRDEQQLTI